MPAKIIRDNAFQQCTFSHVTQLSSCSWVLSHIWQNIGANICYEDSGSCFWLYDWPLVCVKNSQSWQQMTTFYCQAGFYKSSAVLLISSRGW